MVLVPSYSGRTELKCVFCDRLDPMEMAEPWADGHLLFLFPSQSPERTAPVPAGLWDRRPAP
jgi:hypothetical protein